MSIDPTKERLLEAAGEEFAAKGFDGATIRSISRRAGANVAAINYHFGDKERLYEAVLIRAHHCSDRPPSAEGTDPVVGLREYIRNFLGGLLDRRDEASWTNALIAREMVQPTVAVDTLVREAIRPRFDHLVGLIRRLRPGSADPQVHAIAFSVVGQILHYKVARPISTRLIGDAAYDRFDLEFLTEHIAAFSLAAILGYDRARSVTTTDAPSGVTSHERGESGCTGSP